MFTQRCFIKKNNAELLRKLEDIGLTFVPNGYGEWNIPIEDVGIYIAVMNLGKAGDYIFIREKFVSRKME